VARESIGEKKNTTATKLGWKYIALGFGKERRLEGGKSGGESSRHSGILPGISEILRKAHQGKAGNGITARED